MLAARTTTPLLFAVALLEPPCGCRSFSLLFTLSGPVQGLRSRASGSLSLISQTTSVNRRREVQAFSYVGGGGAEGSDSDRTRVPLATFSRTANMTKRSWAKKRNERSRAFAKRGRVGGLGDYGPDHKGQPKGSVGMAGAAAAEVATTVEEGSPARERNARQRQENYKRKSLDVHPGSYAGDLANMLSEERRQALKDRFARDERVSREEGAAVGSPDATSDAEGSVTRKPTKKKVGLLLSYWGSNYQGLQINEGARTIEAELELALYLAGVVSKDNFGNVKKISWSRSGRTDKGVHAAAQLISLKLTYVDGREQETIEAINGYLPDDIRVVEITRVCKSFDARLRCSGRRYEYMLPTFTMAPKEYVSTLLDEALSWEQSQPGHGDDAKSASAGDGDGLAGSAVAPPPAEVVALPERDQPRASAGASPTRGSTPPSRASEDRQLGVEAMLSGDGDGANLGQGHNSEEGDERQEELEDEVAGRLESVELSSPAVVQRVAARLAEYRLPPASAQTLRETLETFVGTRNYHNYTNHKKSRDPSCKRHILSFTASEPFVNDGVEWVRLTVMGQSFVLHQIRKMVASTVDRVRGQSSEKDLLHTFDDLKMNLGIAPGEGLYMERPLFEPHNNHLKRQGLEDRLLAWETGASAEAIEHFKRTKIQAGIVAKERTDHDFVEWLDRFTRYPCNY